MDETDQEPINVGIKNTTLQEIYGGKDGDFQQRLIESDLFQGDHSQIHRFVEIPPFVPYRFTSEGLQVLYAATLNGDEWKTIPWEGEPVHGLELNRVYMRDKGAGEYAMIAKNEKGGVVWQKMEEVELPSMKTGRSEWEYKFYYLDHPDAASLNNSLNERGYVLHGHLETKIESLPEGLESVGLEPDYMDGEMRLNNLIWDPDRAEMRRIVWHKAEEGIADKMAEEGWELADSNIARGIYIRTKPSEEST